MKYLKMVARISARLSIPQQEAKDVLSAFFDELEGMPEDERMRLPLGSFSWRKQKSRPITMADGRRAEVTP